MQALAEEQSLGPSCDKTFRAAICQSILRTFVKNCAMTIDMKAVLTENLEAYMDKILNAIGCVGAQTYVEACWWR